MKMTKLTKLIAIVTALLLLLTACGTKPASVNAPPPESVAIGPTVTLSDAFRDAPTLFCYTESGVYQMTEAPPLPEGDVTLGDFFLAVQQCIFGQRDAAALLAADLQKAYVTYDISGEWLAQQEESQLAAFAHSLGMTLRKNVAYCDVGFTVDGEFGRLGDTVWEVAPLHLLENPTEEDFRALRAKVPYGGMTEREDEYLEVQPEAMRQDATAAEIRTLLRAAGAMHTDFDTPAERNMSETLYNLFWTTPQVDFHEHGDDYFAYYRELMPLVASVQDSQFWFREHIEETARLLYGDAFTVEHQTSSTRFQYFPLEGVYTPPHMGIGWALLPVVYSYVEDGDTITAEIAIISGDPLIGLREVVYQDGVYSHAIEIDFADLADYIAHDAIHRTVTLHREADGRLTLQAHHFNE